MVYSISAILFPAPNAAPRRKGSLHSLATAPLDRPPRRKQQLDAADADDLESPGLLPGQWQWTKDSTSSDLALTLPPPFLQDSDSTPQSFEGNVAHKAKFTAE